MVTQEITIYLDNVDPLDPIRMVSGDIGREIRFTVYRRHDVTEPIDLETYSAEVTFIKPDKTFVNEVLDTDQLEIPEQAGAVTGRGYYQVRIYTAGTHQIYSGQGDFIVDDNILNAEVIESVAEIDGYKFPDDFYTVDKIVPNPAGSATDTMNKLKIGDKIYDFAGGGGAVIDDAHKTNYTTWSSEKIENEIVALVDDNDTNMINTWSSYKINQKITGMIKDWTTSDDYTWSSQKIANELANISPAVNYSTTERKIGKWVDNSDLYAITIELTGLNFTAQSYITLVPASAGYTLIGFDNNGTFLTRSNGQRWSSFGYAPNGGLLVYQETDNSIQMSHFCDGMTFTSGYVTIIYTK